MHDDDLTGADIDAILDAAEKRIVEQVHRDVELMGPLHESEIKQRVKEAPAAVRGTLAFAMAGLSGLRRSWSDAGRLGLGEAYAQAALRSIACFLSTEDFGELVGIGRVMGESEALLAIARTGKDGG